MSCRDEMPAGSTTGADPSSLPPETSWPTAALFEGLPAVVVVLDLDTGATVLTREVFLDPSDLSSCGRPMAAGCFGSTTGT